MAIVNVTPEGLNDPEYLEALSKATSPAEMVEARNNWLIVHGATTPDRSGKLNLENFQDPDAAASGTVSRTVKIYGTDQTFSASTVLELEKQIGAAYQAAASAGGTHAQPRDPATGQFVPKPEPNPAEMYELEMKMKRGEITIQ